MFLITDLKNTSASLGSAYVMQVLYKVFGNKLFKRYPLLLKYCHLATKWSHARDTLDIHSDDDQFL